MLVLYYLRSTTIVTRLTEHDDVIKSLLRGPRALVLHWAPHLLGPALAGHSWFETNVARLSVDKQLGSSNHPKNKMNEEQK